MQKADNWRPKDAWRCAAALVALELGINFGLRLAMLMSVHAEHLLRNNAVLIQNVINLFRFGMWLLFSFGFSQSRSITYFAKRVGFTLGVNIWGWFAGVGAIGIAQLDHYWMTRGLTSTNETTRAVFSTGGNQLGFFVVFAILVAPFYEETVLRGYLYTAFRPVYGRLASMFFVLSITTYFHWSLESHNVCTTFCLTLLFVLLVAVREWTASIWNCILCHAAYNAAGTVSWQIYVAIMIVLLPLCLFFTVSAKNKKCEG